MNGSFFMLLQIFYDLSKKTEEKKVVSLQNKDFVKMCQDPYVIVFSGTFVSRVLLFHVVTVCHVCFFVQTRWYFVLFNMCNCIGAGCCISRNGIVKALLIK